MGPPLPSAELLPRSCQDGRPRGLGMGVGEGVVSAPACPAEDALKAAETLSREG